MQVFSTNPWFQSLSQQAAEALLEATTTVPVAAGAFLFRQGDPVDPGANAFFGVASGALKLSIFNAEGDEVILTLVEPGNWFGGVSTLDQQPRGHCAVALEDAEVLAVSAARFEALMRDAAFAAAIARLVAMRLRLAYGSLASAALQGTRVRVARRIAMLAHGDVSQSAQGRATINTSQDALAMMLGISRQTLSKELQALVKLGAIRLRYGHIEIQDMSQLLGVS
ncbi:Crp/Fnr family transcriptional regulator [Ralstonia flaminis]|jgi:CRP/FNR family cyclic AMP-dependent transcriptional regulator|uniref:CRP-like cAMP-activated global transcriptional regulator n=1 Tax=Ralstonia flaminis TaxID=3058597 RepID=A0ABN9JIX9_9RALS|nr:Crp/Fnr family transcriptional regulator [Ralstonia sp. LMG 18101]CAJ0809925.1 CRP-like cAMP-activated global transcriptional regulator [Ralstonia sp. LMG 18101]